MNLQIVTLLRLLAAIGMAGYVCSAHAETQVGSAPYRASATGAGNSHSPVFSADGRHVAFVSRANNLVTNDDLAPHLDLFVRDLVTSNTVLVSVSTNGIGGGNDNVGLYTLSSNAQVIVFDTAANNLATGDTNRVSDIYVRDLLAGTTRLVSVNADGTGSGNGPSSNPLISEDGRYVIFESLASNLVTNDFNGTNDIFICDLLTGITTLVTVNADGTTSPDGPSHSPSISADGLTVAFVSHATNLVAGVTNRFGEVYARSIGAGSNRWAKASHLAATHEGLSNNGTYRAFQPQVSSDGRFVAFKTLGQVVRFDLGRSPNYIFRSFTNQTQQGARIDYFRFDDNPRLGTTTDAAPLAFTHDGRYLIFGARYGVGIPQVAWVDFEDLTTNILTSLPYGVYFETNVTPRLVTLFTNLTANVQGSDWTQMPWLAVVGAGDRFFFLADPLVDRFGGGPNRWFQLFSFTWRQGLFELRLEVIGNSA